MRQSGSESRRRRGRLGYSQQSQVLDRQEFVGTRMGTQRLHSHPARSQQVQNGALSRLRCAGGLIARVFFASSNCYIPTGFVLFCHFISC